jgi:hypothetical protein
MKSCQKCLAKQDWICLDCGGCPDCCRCPPSRARERWVHIATLEGSIKRNEIIRTTMEHTGLKEIT